MPKAFLINRHRIKRDNYRTATSYYDDFENEIENEDIENDPEIKTITDDDQKIESSSRLDGRLPNVQEDCLYNLKRLAEITLAYFNYQDTRKNVEETEVMSAVSAATNDATPLFKIGIRVKISNSDNGSHRCWDCGKTYSTSSNLARHRQTHRSLADKKAKRCEYCGKVYVSIPAYSMHVRTHIQNCKCNICGKCFSRPWLLQGHIRTHTGEKPYKCSVCDKAFADKSNLRAHVQTHSSAKPYICPRCGKAFTLKSYLYKHEESSCLDVKKEQMPFFSSTDKQIPNLRLLSIS